jgi:probable rRNA maturation factor
MEEVRFFSEGLDFTLKGKRLKQAWIKECIRLEKKRVAGLSFIFCSDSYLLEINKKYLKHNTLTDTVSFNYALGAKVVEGDVYISVERVLDNSVKYSVTFNEEISRVMIHGTLHLCGYSDKPAEEKVIMTKKENRYLTLQKSMFHVKPKAVRKTVPRGTIKK